MLGSTATGADDYLDALIARTGAAIAHYLGYAPATPGAEPTVEAADYTDYYDGDGSGELWLRRVPVNSITTLAHRPSTTDSYDTIDSADYILYGEEGIVRLHNAESAFWPGWKSIKVVYNAGFSTVPADLEEVAIRMVVRAYRRAQSLEVSSKSAAEVSVSFVRLHLTDDDKAQLQPYRIYRAAMGGILGVV